MVKNLIGRAVISFWLLCLLLVFLLVLVGGGVLVMVMVMIALCARVMQVGWRGW